MKTALIAGGAGFIGSHLADRLLSEGYSVIAVDNLISGEMENISHLKDNPNFKFINHDIRLPIKIEGAVDRIYNLASPASPVDYANFPVETLQVGSVGTNNLLDLAKEKNARFLMASTSEVYGDPEVSPQPESYWGNVNPVGPRSCYDEAKRYAEALTMAYRKKGVDTRIIRIFNTYGPRMRINDGRVVPAFCSQAITGKPLTIFGEGKQTRSFCYVDDLVDGMYKLMESDYSQGPMNIGNPGEFTMIELAEKVQRIVGSDCIIEFHPLPQDDPKQRKPDITLAKKILGWEPKVRLDEGLVPTIEYFRKKLR